MLTNNCLSVFNVKKRIRSVLVLELILYIVLYSNPLVFVYSGELKNLRIFNKFHFLRKTRLLFTTLLFFFNIKCIVLENLSLASITR